MLKKRTIIRIKNIIISTLLASFLLNTVSYAEINSSQMNSVISKINAIEDTVINTGNLDIEEVDLSYTLKNDNWIAFYKNFIRELGGIRISYYNESGNLIAKKNVLPKQFEGSSYEYERDTVYVEDTFILRDTVNKYYIDLSNCSFTDNIPCFIDKNESNTNSLKIEENEETKNVYVDVDFSKWENCKTISEWLEDRSNLQNLTDELGVEFEGSDNLEVWLSKNEENCKSAGILIEPITFYPDSTEEIYCNDKTISKNYNLTHGITSSRLETEMKERGEWNWWTSIVTNVSSFLNLNSLNIYIHIGILKYNLIGTIGKAVSKKKFIDIVYVMVYNYIMKVKEIIKKIESEGWYIVRQKGSHRQYKNNNIKGLVTIAGKLSDEIDKGTLNSILKQAGLK